MNGFLDLFSGGSISPVWMWLIVAVVFAVIEGITMGLTTIWFAGGALAAALVSFLTDNSVIQLLVFIIVSIVLLILTRPIAVRQLNRKTVKTNLDAVIGTLGTAQSAIRELEPGTVRADGKEWTAVLAEGSEAIEAGDRVRIHEVSGVKLVVSKAESWKRETPERPEEGQEVFQAD